MLVDSYDVDCRRCYNSLKLFAEENSRICRRSEDKYTDDEPNVSVNKSMAIKTKSLFRFQLHIVWPRTDKTTTKKLLSLHPGIVCDVLLDHEDCIPGKAV